MATALGGLTTDSGDNAARGAIPAHAWFALGVLAFANLFNYLDRYILSILAQSIKADLKLDDAQLGFLLGTAFAVFYAVVGIAMGRISDRLSRKRLMAFGLALWSTMTALGGMATSFLWLSVARIGVGVGEATAGPCSHALLADIFPPRRRATALAIYLTGTYAGAALAMILGGLIVQNWGTACRALPFAGACEFAGWQAALFAVGLPGLPLALLLLCIREPARARKETASAPGIILHEMTAALPPFTFFVLHRLGGMPALLRNVALAGIVIGIVSAFVAVTNDLAQWAAVGLGIYTVATWGHVQRLRDRPLYALTFGDPTFVLTLAGAGLLACIGGAVSVWAAPYAMRVLGFSPVETGLSLGLIHAAGAVTGVLLGGLQADRLKHRDRGAPIKIAIASVVGEIPFLAGMLMATDETVFLVCFAGFAVASALWGGAFAALTQDLVMPRMRGAAASAFSLFSVVVASGIGPYWAGKVSAVTGSLQAGLYSMLLLVPVVLVVFAFALPRIRVATLESRRDLAIAAGEIVEG